MPSNVGQSFCRKAAHDLLAKMRVAAQSEIDLEMLAFAAGKLLVEEGGLETSEGRLVASQDKGGCIRVKSGMNPGRRRFTIAHEIGHLVLHPLLSRDHQDQKSAFTI